MVSCQNNQVLFGRRTWGISFISSESRTRISRLTLLRERLWLNIEENDIAGESTQKGVLDPGKQMNSLLQVAHRGWSKISLSFMGVWPKCLGSFKLKHNYMHLQKQSITHNETQLLFKQTLKFIIKGQMLHVWQTDKTRMWTLIGQVLICFI